MPGVLESLKLGFQPFLGGSLSTSSVGPSLSFERRAPEVLSSFLSALRTEGDLSRLLRLDLSLSRGEGDLVSSLDLTRGGGGALGPLAKSLAGGTEPSSRPLLPDSGLAFEEVRCLSSL